MPDQLQRYQSYKDAIERLMFFCGLWPIENPSRLYRLLPFVHCTAVGLMSFAILNFALYHSANLYLWLKGLGAAFGFWAVLQKTICLMVYRKRLMKLHASLGNAFNEDIKDSILRPILLSPIRTFRSPSFVLIIMTFGVHSTHWIMVVVSIFKQYYRHADPIKYTRAYATFYPWAIIDWRILAHYLFELYAGFTLAAFSSSVDLLFSLYVFQMCGQLRTLSHRMKIINSNEDYRKVIRECVIRHQILTRCQEHLEHIYGPIVLCMLIVTAMIMCSLIYQASQISAEKAVLVLPYLAMKSLQVLYYGAFGSSLTTEIDKFRQAIYACDWAGSGEKCLMTDVLAIITYQQLPMKACSLSTISVDMFVAVWNTAFSYFFMIRTLEEKT